MVRIFGYKSKARTGTGGQTAYNVSRCYGQMKRRKGSWCNLKRKQKTSIISDCSEYLSSLLFSGGCATKTSARGEVIIPCSNAAISGREI